MKKRLASPGVIVALLLMGVGTWGAPAKTSGPAMKWRKEVMKMYAFDTWRDAEKTPGQGVTELPALADSLKEKYGRAQAIGAIASRWQRVTVDVYPEDGKRTRTALLLQLCESPQAAKSHVVQALGATSMLGPVFSRAKPGSPEDRGDVCFLAKARDGQVALMFFARANVFVKVMVSIRGGDARVLDIATVADKMITDHLRDMKFPLKMDEDLHLSPRTSASRDLADAVKRNDIAALRSYVHERSSPRERDQAVGALAATPDGRAELFKVLNEEKMDRFTSETVLAALSNTKAFDVIEPLRRYVQTAEEPGFFGAALEAAAKSMPFGDAQRFCIREAERLADQLDASAEKLAYVVKGLSPGFMREGDPAQTVILRQILRRTKNEKLRARCYSVLAEWVLDGSDVRDEILRLLRPRLNDSNARVRSCAARTLGRSRDVRDVRLLLPLLNDEDRNVRSASARSICELLGWETVPRDAAGIAQLKTRLAPIFEALRKLEEAIPREE